MALAAEFFRLTNSCPEAQRPVPNPEAELLAAVREQFREALGATDEANGNCVTIEVEVSQAQHTLAQRLLVDNAREALGFEKDDPRVLIECAWIPLRCCESVGNCYHCEVAEQFDCLLNMAVQRVAK
jgi:hypothetical protein